MTKQSLERLFLLLILVIYGFLGALFAVRTPDWQVPDEPAHYNYIAQVAETGCCPVIEMGDWQQDYQSTLISNRFDPALLDGLTTIEYEDHQPPLYYLIASVVFRLTEGSLTALRLLSVFFGAGVVFVAYRIGKLILPQRGGVALAMAAFVAFLPQHMAMMAGVNNDSLAELLIALTLWAMLAYVKGRNVPVWGLGLMVGLIFVTKSTGYFLAGVVPLAILLHWWPQRQAEGIKPLVQRWGLFLLPALLLGALWAVRNLNTYGMPDFLGLGAHDSVVSDQTRTAEMIEQLGFSGYLNTVLHTTFNSFWGQFGWMALPLQPTMYRVLQGLVGFVIVGLLLDFALLRRREDAPKSGEASQRVWVLLWVVMGLATLAFVYYNSEFMQPQGRYLYPALIPFALLMALGVDAWRRWLLPRHVWAEWIPLAVLGLLAVLDFYLIWRVIPPLLSY